LPNLYEQGTAADTRGHPQARDHGIRATRRRLQRDGRMVLSGTKGGFNPWRSS